MGFLNRVIRVIRVLSSHPPTVSLSPLLLFFVYLRVPLWIIFFR